MPPLFRNLLSDIVSIFTGKNFFFHVLAVALTYIIVISGLDWKYFLFVRDLPLRSFLSPATGLGMLVPIFGLPLLFMIAKLKNNKKLLMITWAVATSAFLAWLISSFYKALTGRVQPPRGAVTTLIDSSHNWNFGFFEHGIFWGWPSSHTMVAFAMSFVIITLFPKKKLAVTLALLYAFYIGLGISMQIHWLSEFVAGAIIGAVIGIVVGKSFKR